MLGTQAPQWHFFSPLQRLGHRIRAHGQGCGMSTGGDGPAILRRTLAGYLGHPNFAASLLIGLGCEVNQITLYAKAGPGAAITSFDIQDVGARFYTYIWTLYHAMHAAARLGLRVVVLDRGRVLADSTPDSLTHHGDRELEEVFLAIVGDDTESGGSDIERTTGMNSVVPL